MRVLITGGLGFLGSQLARLILDRGTISNRAGEQEAVDEIVLFDAGPPPNAGPLAALLGDPRVRVVTGDLCDPAACAPLAPTPDFSVFHLAGVMSGQAEKDFDLALRVNFEGTQNLLEVCRARQCDMRIIFASTIAVFGATDGQSVGDASKLRPLNTYGMTKALCELLLNDVARKGFVDARVARLPTVVVRPGVPNAATTSAFSGVVREPLAGVDIEVPVARDLPHALIGHRTCLAGLLALHDAPKARVAEVCRADRVVTLPSVRATLGDLEAASRRVAAPRGLRLGVVTYRPDPFFCEMVGSMAAHTDATRALALGVPENPSLETIIEQYLEDFGVAGSGLYRPP